jgi:hypothetical protein
VLTFQSADAMPFNNELTIEAPSTVGSATKPITESSRFPIYQIGLEGGKSRPNKSGQRDKCFPPEYGNGLLDRWEL